MYIHHILFARFFELSIQYISPVQMPRSLSRTAKKTSSMKKSAKRLRSNSLRRHLHTIGPLVLGSMIGFGVGTLKYTRARKQFLQLAEIVQDIAQDCSEIRMRLVLKGEFKAADRAYIVKSLPVLRKYKSLILKQIKDLDNPKNTFKHSIARLRVGLEAIKELISNCEELLKLPKDLSKHF